MKRNAGGQDGGYSALIFMLFQTTFKTCFSFKEPQLSATKCP